MEALRPGQRIGAYKIVRQLGVGGMGQVYEAEHVALGVRRALKVFSTVSEHSEFLRKRFVAEGRILADLQHPRIVRVYDLVVDEDRRIRAATRVMTFQFPWFLREMDAGASALRLTANALLPIRSARNFDVQSAVKIPTRRATS